MPIIKTIEFLIFILTEIYENKMSVLSHKMNFEAFEHFHVAQII